MIFIPSDTISFQYENYKFGRHPNLEPAAVRDLEELKEIFEMFKLNKNTVWIADSIMEIPLASNFLLGLLPFPKGVKGKKLAENIASSNVKKYYRYESASTWDLILKTEEKILCEYFLPFSGSKLRELLQLTFDIVRRDGNLNIIPSTNFLEMRDQLLKIRYPRTLEQRAGNIEKAKMLPQPWKANFVGVNKEQQLELKATIKDKVDLERAKKLFNNQIKRLEEIVEDLA